MLTTSQIESNQNEGRIRTVPVNYFSSISLGKTRRVNWASRVVIASRLTFPLKRFDNARAESLQPPRDARQRMSQDFRTPMSRSECLSRRLPKTERKSPTGLHSGTIFSSSRALTLRSRSMNRRQQGGLAHAVGPSTQRTELRSCSHGIGI
jgi:hypothetical protein